MYTEYFHSPNAHTSNKKNSLKNFITKLLDFNLQILLEYQFATTYVSCSVDWLEIWHHLYWQSICTLS